MEGRISQTDAVLVFQKKSQNLNFRIFSIRATFRIMMNQSIRNFSTTCWKIFPTIDADISQKRKMREFKSGVFSKSLSEKKLTPNQK